jgi:hypothetical protein
MGKSYQKVGLQRKLFIISCIIEISYKLSAGLATLLPRPFDNANNTAHMIK